MKEIATLLFLMTFNAAFGQTNAHKEKFSTLEPDVWLGIWDKENSGKGINIDTISYDEIPKYLDFRGTVVEALSWEDDFGENLMIQTVTGQFNWKDYDEDSTDYMIQDKSELYAYLFQREKGEQNFKKLWRVYDYTECFGVDWFTGFISKGTTITDVDNDGITEVTIPYVLICRGGMDPGTMKVIMYEGDVKYALRGSTMLLCKGDHPYGGEFKPSENLVDEKALLHFLTMRWESHKCENERFY